MPAPRRIRRVVAWLALATVLPGCRERAAIAARAGDAASTTAAVDTTAAAPGALAADPGAIGAAAPQPGYPRQERDRTVLGDYPTGGARRERFELSIGACTGNECPVQVRLLDDAGARGTVSLDWASVSRDASRSDARGLGRSANPLDTTRREAWSTGEEESAIQTTARLVRLAPGVPGLLVWQRGGFEHLKRRHYVVAPVGGRLERVWTGEELGGPSYSDVAVVRDSAGVDALLFFQSVTPAGEELPDFVSVAPLVWSGRGMRAATGGGPRVAGVVTAPFAALDSARAARDAARDCFADFYAVPAPARSGQFVLLAVVPSESVAAALRDRVARCAPATRPRLVPLSTPYESDAGR